MKILLADDEKLIRSSLRSMLEELEFSFIEIEEATNGTEMVEKLKNFQADVAFVDIQMPGLTGLEAINICQSISPGTQWIILTGYSEFSYAKQALELGASGYLLKPVSPEDLHDALKKALKSSRENLGNLSREFEFEMSSYLHGMKSVNELNPNLLNSQFLNTFFVIDSKLEEQVKAKHLALFCSRLQEIIDQHQTQETRAAFFPLSNKEIVFITAWNDSDNGEGEQTIKKCIHSALNLLPNFSNDDFNITMLTSNPSRLIQLRQLVQDLKDDTFLRVVLGIKQHLFYSKLKGIKKEKGLISLAAALVKLTDYYHTKSTLNYMKVLDDIEKSLSSMNYNQLKEPITDYLNCVIPCKLNKNAAADEWINTLRVCGDNLLKENNSDEDRSQLLIDQVIKYVEEHYMEDIGIGQIAQELHVTPNYLSTLFHKRIGVTFIKHLTRIRILKAKELLADPKNKVQKVAETVGYYSTRHFTKLFTEIIGCYPSEFQKNIRSGIVEQSKAIKG
jgi:two-component system, response regulator YesN